MKRTYKIPLLALAGLAVLALIVLFNPAFQRWVALGQLEKIDPNAKLERLAVGPFSAEVRGLELGSEDWRLALPTLDLEYSPWSLPVKHVVIRRLRLEGMEAELSPASEAGQEKEESGEGLPGIWELTDLGWRISLERLALDAQLKLPGLDMSANLTGGGLAPEATGVFELEALQLRPVAAAEAVKEVALSGTLRLSESKRGALTSLAWVLNAEATGASFDRPPRLGISGDWTAGVGWAEADPSEGVEGAYPAESFSLRITDDGKTASGALLFESDGNYDAAGERIDARFQLHADNAALAPFARAKDLPRFDGKVDGDVGWDLATMTGTSSMKMNAEASKLERLSDALQEVGELRMEEAHELSFDDGGVRLEVFSLAIRNRKGDEVFALETSHPLNFTQATLEAEHLGEHGFEGLWLSLNTEIPLEWLDPVLGGLRLRGADLRGRFDFSGHPLDHLVISSEAPFQAEGMTLDENGSVLLKDITISLSPRLEIWPDKGMLALDGLQVRAREDDLLQGQLKADIVFGGPETWRAGGEGEMEASVESLLSRQLGEILPAAASGAQLRMTEMTDALGPSSLKMSWSAAADRNEITAESLSAELVRRGGATLLEARLLNPVKMSLAGTGPEFEGMDGTWLEAASHGLPVDALAVLIDGCWVEGGGLRGGFTLAAGAEPGGFVLESTEAWSVSGLSIGPEEGEFWMKAVDFSLRPGLDYSPGRARLELTDISAAQGDDILGEGELSADIGLDRFDPESVEFSLAGRAALVPVFE
ncbi:MAG TPA: hypothetical protein VJ952_07660, partial [Opitutales bacterium]|nr:hypothetical protein [Opitutales bacterium]